MSELERLLALLVAVILAAAARGFEASYPVFLAIGGRCAFLPVSPELALALFVAVVRAKRADGD
jgi:hypothetical protein